MRAELGAESGTGTGTGTGMGIGTGTGSESGSSTGAGSESGTGTGMGSGSESGAGAGMDTGSGPESSAGAGTGPIGVVVAAGAGTRLGELGRRYSKAMVPLAGRPLIAHVLERLRAAGVGRVVVVRHAGDRALAEYLAHTAGVAMAVQAERRGIADAVACALPLVGGAGGYLACACDSLFAPADLAAVIAAGSAGDAAVGVLAMDAAATASRSAVEVDGGRVRAIVEKPPPGSTSATLVAAPLYWLPRTLDARLRAASAAGGERYVTTALAAHLAAGGTVRAVPLAGRIEITTAADLARAERKAMSNEG